jgi:uncharacterized membrane protein (UPF0136 family)
MQMVTTRRHVPILLAAVLLNYAAQVPYYLHQYYFPRHSPPSLLGVALLSATFMWFSVGYFWYVTGRTSGLWVLLAFLAIQILFYAHAILFGLLTGGGIVGQLRTNSPFLLVVFLIGYLNFTIAGYYAWRLLKHKGVGG